MATKNKSRSDQKTITKWLWEFSILYFWLWPLIVPVLVYFGKIIEFDSYLPSDVPYYVPLLKVVIAWIIIPILLYFHQWKLDYLFSIMNGEKIWQKIISAIITAWVLWFYVHFLILSLNNVFNG